MSCAIDKSTCKGCIYAKESLCDWPFSIIPKARRQEKTKIYPDACPKCQGRAILRERDDGIDYATCLYCGWSREVVPC